MQKIFILLIVLPPTIQTLSAKSGEDMKRMRRPSIYISDPEPYGAYACRGKPCADFSARGREFMAGCMTFCTFGDKLGHNVITLSEMMDFLKACEAKAPKATPGICNEAAFAEALAPTKLCPNELKNFFNYLCKRTNSTSLTAADMTKFFHEMGVEYVTAEGYNSYWEKLFRAHIYDKKCDSGA